MSGLHVLVGFGDGDVEVQIETENSPCDEHHKYGKRSVFEIGDLDFHRSEFNPPANVGFCWRGFEADVLPVCGLQVFEVVCFREV